MRRKLIAILITMLLAWSGYSQVSVPLTHSDLMDIKRERDIMKMMNIDVSQTWLYMVKDNVVSSNKILISEILYNKQGCPNKIIQFDDDNQIQTYTVVKYNSQHLPFEEITFTKDSSLINGIMYIYNSGNLIQKQINYNNRADVLSEFIYSRINDSIIIKEFDGDKNLVSSSIIITSSSSENQELVNSIMKKSIESNLVEQQCFQYDEMAFLRKKTVFEEGKNMGHKEFIYNNEGALIKSSYYDNSKQLITDTSYEYDSYGNMIRLIERKENDNSTKVYVIKYLTKIIE